MRGYYDEIPIKTPIILKPQFLNTLDITNLSDHYDGDWNLENYSKVIPCSKEFGENVVSGELLSEMMSLYDDYTKYVDYQNIRFFLF